MQYKVIIDGETEYVRTYDGIAPFVDDIGINYLMSSLNLDLNDYDIEASHDDLKGWSVIIKLTSKHKVDWDDQDHTVF